ncbi:MAG: VPLPA-CTERM sorting domain-containing protein [Nitrospira sp.]|nr:MAG: VPLPA-CTERM sorting domain-containing protein [Nitrospira sp.]
MRSHRFISFPTLILLFACTVWSSLAQAAAIDLTEIIFEYDGSPWTLGWKFSVTAPTSVEALGVYDAGQDGLAGPAQVGLWLASGGAPLVQTTVAAGTDAALDGYFRFVPVTSTALTPGIEYIVGAYLDSDATSLFGGNGVVDPRVTVVDARYSAFGNATFEFPGLTDPGTEGGAFLGGNVQLNPVPLPAAAWLFGSGLAGIAAFGRRKNRAISR